MPNEESWNFARKLEEVKVSAAAYHFEYLSIHNQRIALVRLIHLWHQIGFPASLTIYGWFYGLGSSAHDSTMFVAGAVLASLIVLFIRAYARQLDRGVVKLYPRIMALELMLDYHFYRGYLRSKGKSEAEFVTNCEKVAATTTSDLWKSIEDCFTRSAFPYWRRGHKILDIAAGVMIMVYAVVTLLLIV